MSTLMEGAVLGAKTLRASVLEGALTGAAIGAVSGTYARGAARMGTTTLKAAGRTALRGVGMTLRAGVAFVSTTAASARFAARLTASASVDGSAAAFGAGLGALATFTAAAAGGAR